MLSSGMWRRDGSVKTDVTEKCVASILRVGEIYASDEEALDVC
jgi:hypothetical protein